jgi:hypothetical protein
MEKNKLHVTKVQINGVEHLHSNTIGTTPRSRVEFAIKNNLLLFDREYGDYGFTYKTLRYKNFWAWLQGDNPSLEERDLI